MHYFLTALMYLSDRWITLTFVIIYTIYIARKEREPLYFFWLILPLIPTLHFLFNKDFKKRWLIFFLIFLMYSFYNYFLAPSITREKIIRVSFHVECEEYIIEKETDPYLITIIKWHIFKREFLRNLGYDLRESGSTGDLILNTRKRKITIHNYPLNDLLEIIAKNGSQINKIVIQYSDNVAMMRLFKGYCIFLNLLALHKKFEYRG